MIEVVLELRDLPSMISNRMMLKAHKKADNRKFEGICDTLMSQKLAGPLIMMGNPVVVP